MDKGYSLEDWHEIDKAEVRFLGFVVSGCDAPPVLELVEQTLDEVAPAVFFAVVRDRIAPVALGGDDRLSVRRSR